MTRRMPCAVDCEIASCDFGSVGVAEVDEPAEDNYGEKDSYVIEDISRKDRV